MWRLKSRCICTAFSECRQAGNNAVNSDVLASVPRSAMQTYRILYAVHKLRNKIQRRRCAQLKNADNHWLSIRVHRCVTSVVTGDTASVSLHYKSHRCYYNTHSRQQMSQQIQLLLSGIEVGKISAGMGTVLTQFQFSLFSLLFPYEVFNFLTILEKKRRYAF